MHFLIRKNENLPVKIFTFTLRGFNLLLLYKGLSQLGKPLSYFNWEESVKRTVYGLANTLDTTI
jgi:hypothetical protein